MDMCLYMTFCCDGLVLKQTGGGGVLREFDFFDGKEIIGGVREVWRYRIINYFTFRFSYYVYYFVSLR